MYVCMFVCLYVCMFACLYLCTEGVSVLWTTSGCWSLSLTWVLPPLSNSWIIVIIRLYIALNRTPNIDCYWVLWQYPRFNLFGLGQTFRPLGPSA